MQTIRSFKLNILSYTTLTVCTLQLYYTSTQIQDNVLYTCVMCFPELFISFILLMSSFLRAECSVLSGQYIPLSRLAFHIFPFFIFCFYSSSFSYYNFLSVFFFSISPLIEHLLSVLGNDFGESVEEPCLKMDTNVVFYEKQDSRPKVVDSAIIFGPAITDPKVSK